MLKIAYNYCVFVMRGVTLLADTRRTEKVNATIPLMQAYDLRVVAMVCQPFPSDLGALEWTEK